MPVAQRRKKRQIFFEQLCIDNYEKVLTYLYAVLEDESAARNCTQEVFLTALQKLMIWYQHPNPGGFLFQTAKTLAKKSRRESFALLLREQTIENHEAFITDTAANIELTFPPLGKQNNLHSIGYQDSYSSMTATGSFRSTMAR